MILTSYKTTTTVPANINSGILTVFSQSNDGATQEVHGTIRISNRLSSALTSLTVVIDKPTRYGEQTVSVTGVDSIEIPLSPILWRAGETLSVSILSNNAGDNATTVVCDFFVDSTAPANWLTAAGIAANALDGKGNWNIGKTGYGLTPGERTALATVIDSTLLDAGDATDLIAAIVTRIGNTNVDEASFVAAVKAALFDVASAANKLSVNASGEVVASNMRGTDNAMLASSYTAAPTAAANASAVRSELTTELGLITTNLDVPVSDVAAAAGDATAANQAAIIKALQGPAGVQY